MEYKIYFLARGQKQQYMNFMLYGVPIVPMLYGDLFFRNVRRMYFQLLVLHVLTIQHLRVHTTLSTRLVGYVHIFQRKNPEAISQYLPRSKSDQICSALLRSSITRVQITGKIGAINYGYFLFKLLFKHGHSMQRCISYF